MKNSLLLEIITAGLLPLAISTIPASAQGPTTGATGQSPAEMPSDAAPASGTSTTPDQAVTPASRDSIDSKESEAAQPQQQQGGAEAESWLAKLDPQMKAVIDELQMMGSKPLNTLSAEDARKQPSFADATKKVADRQNQKLPDVGQIHEVEIKLKDVDLKGRIYQPEGDGPFPVILYVHGGGWVVGDLDSYDASPRALCKATNALVISTHYRQAPEHKFPTAHHDVYGAYQWTMENAGRWNGNGKQVAIVGESAGGNMAAAATIMAQHEGIQMPVHQVLIYPVANTTMDTESYRQYENAKPLDAATMKWFFDQALTNPADAKDPKIALLQSESFKGLPPVTIITAEIDPLKSEGEALAKKYEQDGVDVTYKSYEGVTHEFFGMPHAVNKAQEAIDFVANQLKQSFGGEGEQAGGASAKASGGEDVGTGIDTGTGTATGGIGAGGPASGGPGAERAGAGGTGSGGIATGEARGTGSGTETDTGSTGTSTQPTGERVPQDRAGSSGGATETEGRTGGSRGAADPDRGGTGPSQQQDRTGETETEIDR